MQKRLGYTTNWSPECPAILETKNCGGIAWATLKHCSRDANVMPLFLKEEFLNENRRA